MISDLLTVLENLMEPVALWDSLKCETLNVVQESIGEHPKTRQNFLSLNTGCHICLPCDSSEWQLGFASFLVCRTLLKRNKKQYIRNLSLEI